MPLFKARLVDIVLTSYQGFSSDRDQPENLTYSELKVFKGFSKNKDIVIQKADNKGITVVILGKCSCISGIEEILNDNSKFS